LHIAAIHKDWLDRFAIELENASSLCLDAAFRDSSADTALRKLRASIAADPVA
jgi:hypothetical protein